MTTVAKQKKGAVTFPRGFTAAGLHCGIKKAGRKDLALICSEQPAVAGAAFTTNRVKAWPVLHCQRVLAHRTHRAILANSGCANCFTGEHGRKALEEEVAYLACELNIKKQEIFVASTGVIGRLLDVSSIVSSIPELCFTRSAKNGVDAARAIMTTDTVQKEAAVSVRIGGKEVRVGGIAKGVGMMKPNMATMLAFVTTDAAIDKKVLQKLVVDVADETFNSVSVDNDTSTNDTVIVLANGCAKNLPIRSAAGCAYDAFRQAVKAVCWELARMMVHDGEGVSRVCTLVVKGARSKAEGRTAAHAVADSMLFKTALCGGDPNWGRIVAALGTARSVKIAFDKIDLAFGPMKIITKGVLLPFDAVRARKEFSKKEVTVTVDLKSGKEAVQFLTSDLTKQYVKINAEYTT